MTRFDDCLKFVLAVEGGFSNHPNDRGGCTNFGIIQTEYDSWRMKNGCKVISVREISPDEVKSIYRENYWNLIRADDIAAPMDLVLFDSAVQHGPRRVARWLQRVVGAAQDGSIGDKTIATLDDFINTQGIRFAIDDFLAIREDFYHDIVLHDPSQVAFEKGWANRLQRLRNAAQ